MNTLQIVVICVVLMVVGTLLAVFARKIVSWLYERTMNFWSKNVNPERKEYTDQKYQDVWYWKAWWLGSVWTYRIIGILIAAFFGVLLIVFLTKSRH